MAWRTIRDTPPEGILLDVKIDDAEGERNFEQLIWKHNLWWDKNMATYVYWTPTHWKRPDTQHGKAN